MARPGVRQRYPAYAIAPPHAAPHPPTRNSYQPPHAAVVTQSASRAHPYRSARYTFNAIAAVYRLPARPMPRFVTAPPTRFKSSVLRFLYFVVQYAYC